MTTEPTPRELLLQLQATVQDVADLASRLDRLTETLGQTYVSRGEYDEARRGDDRRFRELEKDNDNNGTFRRQVAAGFIVGFLLLLVTIALTLARIPGATG